MMLPSKSKCKRKRGPVTDQEKVDIVVGLAVFIVVAFSVLWVLSPYSCAVLIGMVAVTAAVLLTVLGSLILGLVIYRILRALVVVWRICGSLRGSDDYFDE